MKTKKVLRMMLILVLFISGVNVKAIMVHTAGTANWSLSISNLSHNGMSLYVSGIDKAQDVTAHITAGTDSFTRVLSFTNASQTFNLTFDKGYDAGTKVTVFLQDSTGNISEFESEEIGEDYIDAWGDAYPKMYNGEIYGKNVTSVYATVGFQKYEGIIDNVNHTVSISYPQQKVGSIIQITITDGFCSNTNDVTIENNYLTIPSIALTRTQMNLQYDKIPKGCIIYAKIGASVYQSPIGNDEYSEDGVILEYPLQKVGQVVSVWMESEDGSNTTPKDFTIQKCDLRLSDKYDLYAYPKQVSGSINQDYAAVDYVTAQIDNDTYKAQVDSKGNFVIEYSAQKVGKSIIITGYDKHGCSTDPIETSIINSNYTDTEDGIEHVYISEAIGSTSYETGLRLCAQIGDNVYYSEYAATSDQTLKVTYPTQKVGTVAKLWFEEKNGCYSEKVKKKVEDKQLYVDKYKLLTSSIKGDISSKLWFDMDDIKLKSAVAVINGKTYEGTVSKDSFSITFPKQKLGQKVEISVEDEDGYKVAETLEIKNIPIKLNVGTIYYNSTKVTGTTEANAKVAVQVGDKKYTATANASGKFTVNIKSAKVDTGVTITSTSSDGFYNTEYTTVASQYGEVYFENTIYKNTTTVKVTCINGNKGDVLTLKVGSSTYKKELGQSKETQTVSFKITAQSAGKQVKVTLLDSFGKERGSDNTKVYIGDTIKVGMTDEQVVLTTWGAPVIKNNWGTFLQWVFESGSSTVYAYIRNGKVFSIQQLNY